MSTESRPSSYCIGLTGNIGAGKSTAARIFKLLGIPIYDADQAARRCMQENPPLRQEILDHFGAQAYHKSQRLNRSYLAARIFKNPQDRQWIQQQTHPIVEQNFQQWHKKQSPSTPYVLLESALLFETKTYQSLERTLFVTAPRALRLHRVLNRDPQRSPQSIEEIMNTQLSEESCRKLISPNNILQNDNNSLLIPQVLRIHKEINDSLSP